MDDACANALKKISEDLEKSEFEPYIEDVLYYGDYQEPQGSFPGNLAFAIVLKEKELEQSGEKAKILRLLPSEVECIETPSLILRPYIFIGYGWMDSPKTQLALDIAQKVRKEGVSLWKKNM